MKRLKLEELPEELTQEIIEVLAEMANESPESTEWQRICPALSSTNFRKVMDRKIFNQQEQERKRRESLSEEERQDEDDRKRIALENADPKAFYGNMGEPETPQQFKDKYGVWPWGYDENGNKI